MNASPTVALRIFESELRQIADAVAESPRLETGGELLGLWSHADSPTVLLAGVTVLLAGTPAPGSARSATTFELDPQVHMELERLSWQEYGVQVVGLWHSHHQLGLHQLSSGDVRRTEGYSRRHRRPRYSEILAFLTPATGGDRHGDPALDVGLRPYVYADAESGTALPTRVEVLPGRSPIRSALLSRQLSPGLQQVVHGVRRRTRHPVPYYFVPSEGPEQARPHSPSGAHGPVAATAPPDPPREPDWHEHDGSGGPPAGAAGTSPSAHPRAAPDAAPATDAAPVEQSDGAVPTTGAAPPRPDALGVGLTRIQDALAAVLPHDADGAVRVDVGNGQVLVAIASPHPRDQACLAFLVVEAGGAASAEMFFQNSAGRTKVLAGGNAHDFDFSRALRKHLSRLGYRPQAE